ncbi:MAG: hypothetical protein RLZZ292_3742 [Bacteroidota bacterium]|jgi:hypothetical protein
MKKYFFIPIKNPYNRSFFLLLFLLLFFNSATSWAQTPLNTHWERLVLPSYVSPQLYDKLSKTTQAAFEQYQNYAPLRDESSSKVTQKSINLFKPLFASNSKILEDYVPKSTRLVSANDYVATALRNFPKQGLTQEFLNAKINRVAFDSAGYYNVVVDVIKKMYIQLDNGVPSSDLKGYLVECQLFYRISKDSTNKALITRIQSGGDWPRDDPKDILLTGYGRYGLNSFGVVLPSANFAVLSPSDIGIGARLDYITPKGLLFGIGAQLNQQKFQFEQTSNVAFKDTIKTSFTTIIKDVDYKDNKGTWTIQSLSLPIHVGYRVWANEKLRLHIRALFVPTLVQKATETNTPGMVKYVGNYTILSKTDNTKEAEFIIDDLNIDGNAEYHYGTFPTNAPASVDLTTQLGLAVGIEPEIQYSISKALRVSLGINYLYGIGNLFEGNSNKRLFKINETNEGKSVLQTFATGVQYRSAGVQLGVSYKLNWKNKV